MWTSLGRLICSLQLALARYSMVGLWSCFGEHCDQTGHGCLDQTLKWPIEWRLNCCSLLQYPIVKWLSPCIPNILYTSWIYPYESYHILYLRKSKSSCFIRELDRKAGSQAIKVGSHRWCWFSPSVLVTSAMRLLGFLSESITRSKHHADSCPKTGGIRKADVFPSTS